MAKDLTKEREDECKPIAREILKMLGEISDTTPMGGFDDSEARVFFQNFLADKVLPLLTLKNIKTAEATFIMSMVLQPLDYTKNLLSDSLVDAENSAVASKFGLEDIRDIRISHILAAQSEKATATVDKSVA